MEFADQFYSIPPFLQNPNIASYLADQYEYHRLRTDVVEPFPARGELFHAQRILMQMFLFVSSILLNTATGGGKTCAAVSSVEQFKEAMTGAIVDMILQYIQPQKVPYQGILYLVRGPILKADVERQIICKCTAKGVYDTKELDQAQTTNMRSRLIKKNLGPYYKVMGYDSFLGELEKSLDPSKYPSDMTESQKKEKYQIERERIRRAYSHRIIVADEVHILTSEAKNVSRYRTFHNFLHIVEGCKTILMTATPMKNRGVEIADIMNLILPEDQQISRNLILSAFPPLRVELDDEQGMKGKGTLKRDTALKRLEPYIQGRVSHIRAMDIGVDVVSDSSPSAKNIAEEGEEPFWITTVNFFGDQAQEYIRAKSQRGKRRNDIYAMERQLSNAWLPDPSKTRRPMSLSKRFAHYFKRRGRSFEILDKRFAEQYVQPRMKTPDELPSYTFISPKTVEIGEMLSQPLYQGKMMVYSNFKEMGAFMVAIGLQFVYGYEEYKGVSFFQESRDVTYCGTGFSRTTERDPLPGISKRARYGLLIPENQDVFNEKLLHIFNSYENRFGEYIRVLITSQVGREGINTNEIRTYVNYDAHWNQTSYHQALSRVLRSDAYLWTRREREGRVQVYVVNLASELDPDVLDEEVPDEIMETNDIDTAMYLTSRQKDRDIQRVTRFLKENAVDCFLHYKRNVRSDDQDGSAICNYQSCAYLCNVEIPPTGNLHYNVYDLLYAGPEIKETQQEILMILREYVSISLENLQKQLPHHREVILTKAIFEMVQTQTRFTDRLGFPVYIRELNGFVFLQRQIASESENDYSLEEYTRNAPLTIRRSLKDIVVRKNQGVVEDHMNRIDSMSPSDQLRHISNQFNTVQKVMLLEFLYLRFLQTQKSHAYLDRYQNRMYSFTEPHYLLEKQAKDTSFWHRRGRRPEHIEHMRVEVLDPSNRQEYRSWPGEGETIHVHALLSLSPAAEFERYMKADGTLRVYKPSEGHWRDANPYESVVYNKILQVQIHDYNKTLEPLYGIYTSMGLKLYDVEEAPLQKRKKIKTGKKGPSEDIVDLRKRMKGVDCQKYLDDPSKKARFETLFGKVQTCAQVETILEQRGYLVYLFI